MTKKKKKKKKKEDKERIKERKIFRHDKIKMDFGALEKIKICEI